MFTPDIIPELTDMGYLDWSRIRKSSGTTGSFLKASEYTGSKKIYYKLSYFDRIDGITGHESINELIVDRLLTILGIEHLSYRLIHAMVRIEGKEYETWLCASEDFKEAGESKIAFDDYYDLVKEDGESPYACVRRMGFANYVHTMLVVDYLILNRDRHGANIEILRKKGGSKPLPAPLFDHGISLLYSCHNEEAVRKFDVLADIPVQSFVGSRSALQNLALIPENERPVLRELEERDRALLFRGLNEALPEIYQEKIWDMLWKRWKTYEDMCNKG